MDAKINYNAFNKPNMHKSLCLTLYTLPHVLAQTSAYYYWWWLATPISIFFCCYALITICFWPYARPFIPFWPLLLFLVFPPFLPFLFIFVLFSLSFTPLTLVGNTTTLPEMIIVDDEFETKAEVPGRYVGSQMRRNV